MQIKRIVPTRNVFFLTSGDMAGKMAHMQEMMQQALTVQDIGMRIRAARKRQKLSIADTAAMAGVSPRFLGEIERGVRGNVAADKLLQIASLLGLRLYIAE